MSEHAHYAHYDEQLVGRLDGPFGAVDARMNRRIAAQVVGRDVLDFGCGFGSLVAHLAAAGLDAIGVDLLDFQVAAGRARFPGVDLRTVPGDTLPFPDASFDTVVLKESLHHLAAEGDIAAHMAEVARVCRSRIIVLEPNPCLPLKIGRTLIGHVDPTCTPEDASRHVAEGGFTVRSCDYLDTLAFPLSGGYVGRPLLPLGLVRPVFMLDDVLARIGGRHLCWRYLLVADKERGLEVDASPEAPRADG